MATRQLVIALAAAALFALGACGEDDNPKAPALVGATATEAQRKLDAAEGDLTAKFEEPPTPGVDCRVTEQAPRAGAEVPTPSEMRLRCEVEVPDVVGDKAQDAREALDALDFQPTLVNKPPSSDLRRCQVATQSREGSAPPGAEIRVTLRCRT